jgi:hypothetical protein
MATSADEKRNYTDYKQTSDILNKIRNAKFNGYNKKLNEQHDKFRVITPQEQASENAKFKSAVTDFVELGDIKIYPNDVRWDGIISKHNLSFTFALNDVNGLLISGNLMVLDDDLIQILTKLHDYYSVWVDEWKKTS